MISLRKVKQKKTVIVKDEQQVNYFSSPKIEYKGDNYLVMDPQRSKLAAAIICGLKQIPGEDDVVLYLGASAGYTVSFLAQASPLIFAVEISPVMMRELVFLSETMDGIAPVLADAAQPENYSHRICQADYLFQDISQRDQVRIFLRNLELLKKGCYGVLSLKTKSIDFAADPNDIFNNAKKTLEKEAKIVDSFSIGNYQKDHYIIVVQK